MKAGTAQRINGFARLHPILVGATLIVVMTVIVYVPGMRGDFIWDDDANITLNPNVRTLHGLGQTWVNPRANQQYYPVTHTSFWIDYHLWGLRPFPFHLANVLLQSLAAILLWIILRRLSVPGAWFAAAVFALHPVHAESVAWITERKNCLSVVFYLASMLAFIRFAGLDTPQGTERTDTRRWRTYGISLFLFILAFLAKSVTVTLPVSLGVLVWWKRGRLRIRDALLVAPMLVFGAGMGVLTEYLEQRHVGALGEEWTLPFLGKVIVAGRSAWFFAGKLLWPSNLIFVYPRWDIDPSKVWQFIYPAGVVVVVLVLYLLRRRIGRGPLTAVLFYGITLSPAFSFLNVYFMRFSYVQDHFAYPASIGVITLVCALITLGLIKSSPKVSGHTVPAVYAAVLLILGVLTWQHGYIYRNNEVLWRDTLARNPDAWIAHFNLANMLMERGDTEDAIRHFTAATKANPKLPEPPTNLGYALAQQGKYDEAIEQYRKVLRASPRSVATHLNLGTALAAKGLVKEAVGHFREAIRLKPDYAEAHYNLGVLLARQGKPDEAIEEYGKALSANPDHVKAHLSLGLVLAERGKADEALGHFAQALEIDPGSAEVHNNMGIALASRGQFDEALDHFQEAVSLKPDYAEAHFNLGNVLAARGDQEGAFGHFQEAVRLKPDYPQAHFNLAVVYFHKRGYARAWEEVKLCRRYGMNPARGFIQALSQEMPEP